MVEQCILTSSHRKFHPEIEKCTGLGNVLNNGCDKCMKIITSTDGKKSHQGNTHNGRKTIRRKKGHSSIHSSVEHC